ncbi:uncharacterized protein LOC143904226 isoform X2 [Temnothorax americanus]|uniref:uncharacterized protein LOC143904226 isoform X2 n=1 Tax=Temnothorax americanus TaxID=1964332 RepID=UPI0040687952
MAMRHRRGSLGGIGRQRSDRGVNAELRLTTPLLRIGSGVRCVSVTKESERRRRPRRHRATAEQPQIQRSSFCNSAAAHRIDE